MLYFPSVNHPVSTLFMPLSVCSLYYLRGIPCKQIASLLFRQTLLIPCRFVGKTKRHATGHSLQDASTFLQATAESNNVRMLRLSKTTFSLKWYHVMFFQRCEKIAVHWRTGARYRYRLNSVSITKFTAKPSPHFLPSPKRCFAAKVGMVSL